MDDLEASVLASLDGQDPDLLPLLPELLADLEGLGSDALLIEGLLAGRLPSDARLLDLGCGKGAVTLHLLARHPWTALGLDGLPAFIQRARERALELGLADRCRFEVADIRSWGGDGRFDAILLGAIGPILGPLDATLAHLEPWLAPGGMVFLDACCSLGELPAEGLETHAQLMARIHQANYRVLAEVEGLGPDRDADHQRMFDAIARRVEALIQRQPEHRDRVGPYVQNQARGVRRLAQ